MRLQIILILLLISATSQAGSALDTYVDNGGQIIKRFEVDGLELQGLVLRSPVSNVDVVAYTNESEDFIFVGMLLTPDDGTTSNDLANLKNTLPGMMLHTMNHYSDHAPASLKQAHNDSNETQNTAIKNGKKQQIKTFGFLDEVAYISEGNENSRDIMYILYDVNCGYCNRLYNETRNLVSKYQFKWIPIDVMGNVEKTAKDLAVNKVYSGAEAGQHIKENHVKSVIKNTEIILKTGFIQAETPQAIVFNKQKGRYQLVKGITAQQITTYFNYMAGINND